MKNDSDAVTPSGVWLAASYVLGRVVSDDEPYPHIHGKVVRGTVTARRVTVTNRDCAACELRRP